MSRVQVLLQRDSLKFPETPEASRLAARVPYEIRFGKEANHRYAAFRVEAHDDLVTALGLAVPQKGASASTSVFPLHCAPTRAVRSHPQSKGRSSTCPFARAQGVCSTREIACSRLSASITPNPASGTSVAA